MKKILLIFIFLVAGSSAVIAFYWQQATELPTWYNTTTENHNTAPENKINIVLKKDQNIVTNVGQAEKPTQLAEAKSENIKLTEADVNNFIVATIAEHTSGKKSPISSKAANTPIAEQISENTSSSSLSAANTQTTEEISENTSSSSLSAANKNENTLPSSIKGINTKILNGKVETGAVVNISEFFNTFAANNQQETLNKFTEKFPFLSNREVYIGISTKPYIEKGQVRLDDHTEIKVGSLSFTLAELSQKFGISKAQIEQKLNSELKRKNIQLDNLEVEQNNDAIKGEPN